MRVITVLKSGGCYDRRYVENLRKALFKNTTINFEFVCLTDFVSCEYDQPLILNLPGWWSKLEMLDYTRFPGKSLFIDLDTVILKNIDILLEKDYPLIMMRDYRVTRANSCLMSWTRDMSWILKTFKENPQYYMEKFASSPWIGDQAMIEYCNIETANTIYFWQDTLSEDYLVNWTLEPVEKRVKAHLAWWTDYPKPHQITDDILINKYWNHNV